MTGPHLRAMLRISRWEALISCLGIQSSTYSSRCLQQPCGWHLVVTWGHIASRVCPVRAFFDIIREPCGSDPMLVCLLRPAIASLIIVDEL